MGSKDRAADRGARTARRDLTVVGNDIRAARASAGLSLGFVGRAVGMSYSQVGRIERAVHANVSAMQLVRIGAVVGLDIRIRAFPGPAPLRDSAHLALLDRLRTRLHPDLTMRTEVPVLGRWGPASVGRDDRRVRASRPSFAGRGARPGSTTSRVRPAGSCSSAVTRGSIMSCSRWQARAPTAPRSGRQARRSPRCFRCRLVSPWPHWPQASIPAGPPSSSSEAFGSKDEGRPDALRRSLGAQLCIPRPFGRSVRRLCARGCRSGAP